jgi:hypothetical protein
MSRKLTNKIEFDSPATVAELIEALEDLRAAVGSDAIVRTRNRADFHALGGRIKSISAERA